MKSKASKRAKKIEYDHHWLTCNSCMNFEMYSKRCFVAFRNNMTGIYNDAFLGNAYIKSMFLSVAKYFNLYDKKNNTIDYSGYNKEGSCPFRNLDFGVKDLGQKYILEEIKRLNIKTTIETDSGTLK